MARDFLFGNEKESKFWIKGEIPYSDAHTRQSFGKTVKWWPTDAEDTYKPKGNLYGPDDFSYTLNSRGYRSIEFDPKSTKPKLMFIGCSFTAGIGMPYEGVWTSVVTDLLSKHFGVEFEQHNLGLPGYGADAMAQVVFQTAELIKPDLVLALFPAMDRRQHFLSYKERISLIASFKKNCHLRAVREALVTLQTDANDLYDWVKNWHMIDMTLRAIDVPWLWNSYAYELNLESHFYRYVRTDNMMPLNFPPFAHEKDFGRDMLHPGPKAHALYGQLVFDYAKAVLEKKWSSTA
jgi:hypothetical protein